MFERDTRLFAKLHLQEELTATASLATWLHVHGRSVNTVAGSCDEEIVPAALDVLDVGKLEAAVFCNTSQGVISALAAFTSLTTCGFGAQGAHLGLQALHTLQMLKGLHLWEGTFTLGGMAANLSSLNIKGAPSHMFSGLAGCW